MSGWSAQLAVAHPGLETGVEHRLGATVAPERKSDTLGVRSKWVVDL